MSYITLELNTYANCVKTERNKDIIDDIALSILISLLCIVIIILSIFLAKPAVFERSKICCNKCCYKCCHPKCVRHCCKCCKCCKPVENDNETELKDVHANNGTNDGKTETTENGGTSE